MNSFDDQFRWSLDSLDGLWLSVSVIDQRVNTLYLQVQHFSLVLFAFEAPKLVWDLVILEYYPSGPGALRLGQKSVRRDKA